MNEIKQRRLVIKTFHITDVRVGSQTSIKGACLTIVRPPRSAISEAPFVKDFNVRIIKPNEHDVFTNSIMDIIPISTKIFGCLGEGITHTLTGVAVMLTGADEDGVPQGEFGSSEGVLKEKLKFDRAGTPSVNDLIINFDVILERGTGVHREAMLSVHRFCDQFIQGIRTALKNVDGSSCTEKHDFYDVIRPGKKRVVIVKQIAGQGAMYDNFILPSEPSGFDGGRSIIDMGNVPILLSPNEYRDGAIRAMT